MAEKLEIEVVIGADGAVRLETRGLKGESCLAETADVEKALGRVVRREKTREFWQRAASARSGVKQR